jgi:hypothetical protein
MDFYEIGATSGTPVQIAWNQGHGLSRRFYYPWFLIRRMQVSYQFCFGFAQAFGLVDQLRQVFLVSFNHARILGFRNRLKKNAVIRSRDEAEEISLRLSKDAQKSFYEKVASLAGKLQSLAPAVPFCWLHLQAVVQTIRSKTEEKHSGEVRWTTSFRFRFR